MVNINKVFIASLVISIIGTVLTTISKQSPILIFLLGIGPLFYYFIKLLANSKEGLTQTTVDSIYYFGFIVTISSLAASVLSVAIDGIDGDIKHLIAQFGVGLLATGIALVFRMVLIAKLESLTQKDLSETIDEYVRRIDHVVSKVEASADSFDSLSTLLIERTSKTCEAINDNYKDSMLSSGQVFQNELLKILSTFSEESTTAIRKISSTTDEFYGLVKSIKLDSHVIDISSHAGEISAGLARFAQDAANFSKATQEEIQNITKASVNNSLESLGKTFEAAAVRSTELLQLTEAELKKINFHEENESIKAELKAMTRNINSYNKKIISKEEQLDFLVEGVASKTAMAIQSEMSQRATDITEATNQLIKENFEIVRNAVVDNVQSELPAIVDGMKSKITDTVIKFDDAVNSVTSSLNAADLKMVTQSVQDSFSDLSQHAESLSSLVYNLNDSMSSQTNIKIGEHINDTMSEVSRSWQNHVEIIGTLMNEKIISLTTHLKDAFEENDVQGVKHEFTNLSREVKATMQSLEAMKVAFEEITYEARRSMESLVELNSSAKNVEEQIHLGRLDNEVMSQ